MAPFKPINSEKNLKELVTRAKNGDKQAFGLIYELYFQKIYTFIFYRVNHQEGAEDLTEDVFARAWANIKSVREESFGGWLYSIARNRITDHYRREKKNIDIFELENVLASEQNLSEDLNAAFERKNLIEMIRKLTPEQQIVIQLKFIEGLNNQEISELISKSEESIRVLQHRAIKKLQQIAESQRNSKLPNYFTKLNPEK